MMMNRKMAWLGVLLFGACGAQGDFDVKKVVPGDQALRLDVPARDAMTRLPPAGGKDVRDAVGEPGRFYAMTLSVSRAMNLQALALLGVVRAVVHLPPTRDDGDSKVWGPYTPGGLEPATFRLTAQKVADDHYTFKLEARPRASSAEADYKIVLDGESEQVAGDRGKGRIRLDFDVARTLDPTSCENGKATFFYDATQPAREIRVELRGYASRNDGNPVCRRELAHDADYAYTRDSSGAGTFLFDVQANVNDASEAKPLLEQIKIRSRWQADGAGRSDVAVTGGEVVQDLARAGLGVDKVTATECWGASFRVSYQTSAPEAVHLWPTEGDTASCAFSAAELP